MMTTRLESGDAVTERYECGVSLLSDSWLDKAIRVIYRGAYLAHLAVNFLVRPMTRGAYAAVWLEDSVLLIRNSYKPGYTFPCGGIGSGESAIRAVRRELKEEVGLDLPLQAFRLVEQITNDTEFKIDRIYLFEVRLKTLPDLKPDGREVIWLGFRGLDEALEMPVFKPVRGYLREQARLMQEDG